jgi:hypothetical protein
MNEMDFFFKSTSNFVKLNAPRRNTQNGSPNIFPKEKKTKLHLKTIFLKEQLFWGKRD